MSDPGEAPSRQTASSSLVTCRITEAADEEDVMKEEEEEETLSEQQVGKERKLKLCSRHRRRRTMRH